MEGHRCGTSPAPPAGRAETAAHSRECCSKRGHPTVDAETDRTAELTLAQSRLLRAAHIGRVAWTAPDGPHVLPVSSLYRNNCIMFRTSPSGVLSTLRTRSKVAFEIDDIGHDEAWSVVARGIAHRDPPTVRPHRAIGWTKDWCRGPPASARYSSRLSRARSAAASTIPLASDRSPD